MPCDRLVSNVQEKALWSASEGPSSSHNIFTFDSLSDGQVPTRADSALAVNPAGSEIPEGTCAVSAELCGGGGGVVGGTSSACSRRLHAKTVAVDGAIEVGSCLPKQ
ncbi:hypothetical protein PMIN03_001209 [Paraphaeosphaeria minitans]